MRVHASVRMIGTPQKRGEACSFRTLCARARARVGIVQGRGIVVQAGIDPQNFAGIITDTALLVGLVAYTSAKPVKPSANPFAKPAKPSAKPSAKPAKPSAKPSAKPAKPTAKPSVAKEKRKPEVETEKEETGKEETEKEETGKEETENDGDES